MTNQPMRRIFALSLLSMAFLPAAYADHWNATLEARQWAAEPAGTFTTRVAVFEETLNFESDLGLMEDEALEGRLVFRPSQKTMIVLGYVPEIALAGDNVVSRSLTFLNQSFDFNERVVTDFNLDYARIGFAWQFLSTDDGRFRVGPLVEAKGFRADLSLAAPDASPPVVEEESYEAGFATGGLIADLELSEKVELFGSASVVISGDEGDVDETEFGVRYLPIDSLAIVAGVRTLEIQVEDDDERFVFELDGAFFGLALRF